MFSWAVRTFAEPSFSCLVGGTWVAAAATHAMRESQAEVFFMTVATFVAVATLPEPWLVAINAFSQFRRSAIANRDTGNRCERLRRICKGANGLDRSHVAGLRVRGCSDANDCRGCDGCRAHSEQGNESSSKDR